MKRVLDHVFITRDELADYLAQLDAATSQLMCASCGENFTGEKPKRCPKCSSGVFEKVVRIGGVLTVGIRGKNGFEISWIK